jgi:hypothetical protein
MLSMCRCHATCCGLISSGLRRPRCLYLQRPSEIRICRRRSHSEKCLGLPAAGPPHVGRAKAASWLVGTEPQPLQKRQGVN